MRLIYLLTAHVEVSIAGDILQYVNYSANMLSHGVYSSMPAQEGRVPVPDSFRPPGYPFFLMAAMKFATWRETDWIVVAQTAQIVVSTLSVWMTMLLGRRWLPAAWAIVAGAIFALWPHMIVMASTLLSETVFGFWLLLATWLSVRCFERTSSLGAIVLAGLAWGGAILVNTLIAPWGLVLAIAFVVLAKKRAGAVVLLLSIALLPFIWSIAQGSGHQEVSYPGERSQTTFDRAAINVVQGSWPQYHAAWRTRQRSEISRQILSAIGSEEVVMMKSPAAGIRLLTDRLLSSPGWYLKWYLLQKPYALWAWDIQLGWRGIYFLKTSSSPFERQPVFRLDEALFKWANPVLFTLCALFVIRELFFGDLLSPRRGVMAAAMVAAILLYLTLVHMMFQAEPRYSVAYRSFYCLGFISCLRSLVDAITSAVDRSQNAEVG